MKTFNEQINSSGHLLIISSFPYVENLTHLAYNIESLHSRKQHFLFFIIHLKWSFPTPYSPWMFGSSWTLEGATWRYVHIWSFYVLFLTAQTEGDTGYEYNDAYDDDFDDDSGILTIKTILCIIDLLFR